MTIVGVVRDTRHVGPLRESMIEIYVPYAQFRSTEFQPRALIVRTAGRPERLLPAIQRAVASVDKDQPLVSSGPIEQNRAEFLAPQTFDTTLMAIFGAVGLALAAVGISARWRTGCRGARTKSEYGWRSGRRTAMCCGWWHRSRCARRELGWRSGWPDRGRWGVNSRRC